MSDPPGSLARRRTPIRYSPNCVPPPQNTRSRVVTVRIILDADSGSTEAHHDGVHVCGVEAVTMTRDG